jgi:hypothetical protein
VVAMLFGSEWLALSQKLWWLVGREDSGNRTHRTTERFVSYSVRCCPIEILCKKFPFVDISSVAILFGLDEFAYVCLSRYYEVRRLREC